MLTSIHFEGLPGAGKTTASQRFCGLLRRNGTDANWWREEACNHPLTPKSAHARTQRDNLPLTYLIAWRTFPESTNGTVILDGYAFQSTVRFLYANRFCRSQIEDYFYQWQSLKPKTALVYLAVDNPAKHCDTVLTERGDEWSHKLYRYVERTPLGVANNLRGRSGFVDFWSGYHALCQKLLDAAILPVHIIGSRSWDDDDLDTLAAQAGFFKSD